ncbi:MAG: DUF2165 family protein [Pseudomonadota bacterium]
MGAVLLLVEAVLVASLGIWMAVAVYDNWRHPRLNREAVATVMRLDLMARDFPDDYAFVSHRRVDSNRLIDVAFHTIRWAETVAAMILGVSSALLIVAAFGWAPATLANGLAVLATTYFCAIWAGFIIGGNYFHYYFCHQWGQSNHFMFMYWGLFVLVILII